MKMKHYNALKKIMEYGLTVNPRVKKQHKVNGWTHKAYVWSLFYQYTPKGLRSIINGYLNEGQIETVIMKIVRNANY